MLPPIYDHLKTSEMAALVGSDPARVYRHGRAPQDTSAAYVTWQVVAGVPENTLSDLPGHDRLTIQLDCFSQSDAGVEALARAVRDALEPHAHMTGVPVNEREAATKLFRISLQFDYWLAR